MTGIARLKRNDDTRNGRRVTTQVDATERSGTTVFLKTRKRC